MNSLAEIDMLIDEWAAGQHGLDYATHRIMRLGHEKTDAERMLFEHDMELFVRQRRFPMHAAPEILQ